MNKENALKFKNQYARKELFLITGRVRSLTYINTNFLQNPTEGPISSETSTSFFSPFSDLLFYINGFLNLSYFMVF